MYAAIVINQVKLVEVFRYCTTFHRRIVFCLQVTKFWCFHLSDLSLSDSDFTRLSARLDEIRGERSTGKNEDEHSLGITIVEGCVRNQSSYLLF